MVQKIKLWLNKEFPVLVKHMLLVALFIIFSLASFWFQGTRISREDCRTRADNRTDLRSILFYIVDLSDILPTSKEAEQYRINRMNYINAKYPELDRSAC